MPKSKEHLTIYGVWDNGSLTFTGPFNKLREFALDQHDLMDYEDITRKKLEKGGEKMVVAFLEDIDLEIEDLCEITKDDFTQKTIDVGIYYYIDDDGKKVYDTEEMTNEFETKLNKLI